MWHILRPVSSWEACVRDPGCVNPTVVVPCTLAGLTVLTEPWTPPAEQRCVDFTEPLPAIAAVGHRIVGPTAGGAQRLVVDVRSHMRGDTTLSPCVGCLFYGRLQLLDQRSRVRYAAFSPPAMGNAAKNHLAALTFTLGTVPLLRGANWRWVVSARIQSLNWADLAVPLPSVPQECGYTAQVTCPCVIILTVHAGVHPRKPTA